MTVLHFWSGALRRGVITFALLVASAASYACGPNETGSPCAASASEPASASAAPVSVAVANPVNVITGNKYQRETDMPALPGVLGLEIVRHYNSRLSGVGNAPGIIGRGWKLSYETQLYAFEGNLQIMQADGTRLIFSRDLLNPSLCAGADPANGTVEITGVRGHEQYVWTWTDGRKLTFDEKGRLTQVRAATGEVLTLMYDPRGLLVKVTDPQGRSLRLSYLDRAASERGDRFRGVQSIATPVGRFSYEYGNALPAGASAPALAVAANLARVRYPDGDKPASGGATGRSYHYEDARRPTYLTGITFEGRSLEGKALRQRYATYGYGIDGKAVLSTHALDVNKVTLDYSQPGQTVVTNSLGQKTVYRHAILAGEFRLLEVRGAGCALCGPVNQRYGYDKLGRLRETTLLDSDGRALQTVRAALDYFGRPLKLERITYREGKAQLAQWVRRFEYGDSRVQKPTLVAWPSVMPGKEAAVAITYNGMGQPTDITQTGWSPVAGTQAPLALRRTTHYTYRVIRGRSVLAESDGPLANGRSGTPADSDVTRYEYDADSAQLTRIIAPGNVITEILGRDEALRATLVRSSDGVRAVDTSMSFGYSGNNLGLSQRAVMVAGGGDALLRETRFGYDEAQRLATVTAPGIGTLRTEYDAAGMVAAWVDPKGNRISSKFDGEGRLVARLAQDAAGKTLGGLLNLWDEQSRLRARLQPTGVAIAFGATERSGESVELDGNGDAAASIAHDGRLDIVAADNSSRRMWLSEHALLIQDGANRMHAVVKDDFGRMAMERSPDDGVLRVQYEGAVVDKRHTGKDGRDTVSERLEFLADGRLHRRVRGDCTETLEYQGRLVASLTGCGNTHRFERDAFGAITAYTLEIQAQGQGRAPVRFTTRYVYAAGSGLLSERILPDGQHLFYRYDAADGSAVAVMRDRTWLAWLEHHAGLAIAAGIRRVMPDSLTTEAVIGRVQWRPFGGVASITAANGVTTANGFDAAGRISTWTVDSAEGAVLERMQYRYDGAGNITGVERNAQHSTYRYDGLRRLRSELAAGLPVGVQHASYGYRPDGLRASAASPESDAFGRRPGNGAQRYRYDSAHRLVAVEQDGKEVATYRYDALGNRVAKTVRGRTTYFLYDMAHQLVAEADELGAVTAQYLYVDGRPVAMLRSEGGAQTRSLYAVHADQRGLPLAVTDFDGKVVWRGEFDAFGNARKRAVVRAAARAGGDADPDSGFVMNLRMAGQYADDETGLYYNVHRYYDPRQGRYITPDPMGLQGGEQSYAYVDSNPLGGTDPLGLFHIPTGFFMGKNPLNDFYALGADEGHGDIVRIAFSQYMKMDGNAGRFSQQFIDWVIRNNYHSDVNGSVGCYPVPWTSGGGQCNPKNHFDNPNDGPMYEDKEMTKLTASYQDGKDDNWIQASLDQLNANRNYYQNLTMTKDGGVDISRILSAFGQNAHALADFYAHSNWVDDPSRGGCVKNVAKDGTVEQGYIPVGMGQTTVWDEKVSNKLFTGTVAKKNQFCTSLMYGDVECKDMTTHGYWNKDGEDTDAGKQNANVEMMGWRVEVFNPDAKAGDPGKGNPDTAYGVGWYRDGVSKKEDLKKGDLIFVSYDITKKHELAFTLAVEHTKKEIAKLFDDAAGLETGGLKLQDIFKMDEAAMKKNKVQYDGSHSKL